MSLFPFGINLPERRGFTAHRWRMQIHVVVLRAKDVKDRGELAEIILKLLLPLIKRMDVVTGR
jgi:hypothetical protein